MARLKEVVNVSSKFECPRLDKIVKIKRNKNKFVCLEKKQEICDGCVAYNLLSKESENLER